MHETDCNLEELLVNMNERRHFFIILTCIVFIVGCGDRGNAQSPMDDKDKTKGKVEQPANKQSAIGAVNAVKAQKTTTAEKTVQTKSKSTVTSSENQKPLSPLCITPDKAIEKAPVNIQFGWRLQGKYRYRYST